MNTNGNQIQTHRGLNRLRSAGRGRTLLLGLVTLLASPAPLAGQLPSAAPSVTVASAPATCGQQVEVPISVAGVADLIAAELTIRFDAAKLQDPRVALGSLAGGFALAWNAAEGSVHVAMASGRSVSGSGPLVKVTFRVKDGARGGANVTAAKVLLDDKPVAAAPGEVTISCR